MSIASDNSDYRAKTEKVDLTRFKSDFAHCSGNLEIRLASSAADIEACQRLRYEVFYEEMAARPVGDMCARRLDHDRFDAVADHLMVLDRSGSGHMPEQTTDQVIGTYRLIRRDVAEAHGGFYTAGEYDIAPMIARAGPDMNFLELGRSCVHKDHRNRPTINMLWHGIGHYIAVHDIDVMFGCASFPGTDPSAFAQPLSLLHHNLQGSPDYYVRALDDQFVDMNILPKDEVDERAALRLMPPLIRGTCVPAVSLVTARSSIVSFRQSMFLSCS